MIQRARINFVVVAMARASLLYVLAAPTTELVSWIAIAHQYPNWWSFISNQRPITGKMNRATALSMKMVPMATVISLSLALITGDKAAIALPPQMAVPPETRNPVSRLTFNFLVKNKPNPIVITIENMVNKIPVFPASMACSTFIPKPSPTTDIWRRIWVIRLLMAKNG